MKKLITAVVAILLIVIVGFYLKTQSGYDLVQNEVDKQSEKTNDDENMVNPNEEDSTKSMEDFDRSAEDIALDKKIKEQRLNSEKFYKKNGGILGLEAGKGLSPERSSEEINIIFSAAKDYVNAHPEIYPKYIEDNDEITVGITKDPRFEELIWGTPKEERKGLLEGHDDENMDILEAKKLDGEYDEIFLVRDPDTGEWSVEYVGNYYDFRNKVN